MKLQRISIIGYGRFGKVLHRLLADDFRVTVYTRSPITDTSLFRQKDAIATTLGEVYANDVVFFAVPIESFESIILMHKGYFEDRHVLVDVLSVKMHPKKILEKHLRGMSTQALLTHPMFGPDSSKQGFLDLPIIIDRFRCTETTYAFWKNFFATKQLRVVEMTPEEHDRLAAGSQGLTHFLGRVLADYGLRETPIDSVGTKKLLEIVEQTCNDSWQLFTNLQHYNPHTKAMRLRLGAAYDRIYSQLLPKQVNPQKLTYGIQGGKGSFNEEALRYFLERSSHPAHHIRYLFTSANVLKALHEGRIDRGQFAIHNSAGGVVQESIEAMASYRFRIVDQYAIKIRHALMIRPDALFSQVKTIMTHPQVLAQCKETLDQKYPYLTKSSGTGVMIDHALVAKALSQKELPSTVAVMGSEVLAKLYGLTVVEDNLQDLAENYTTFLQVARW